jgi:predicted HTH transcriptional regulator
MRQHGRITPEHLAPLIQRDTDTAQALLQGLHEAGLVVTHRGRNGRFYVLKRTRFKDVGKTIQAAPPVENDSQRQEKLVLQHLRRKGRITRKQTAAMCRINEDQASYLLRKMLLENKLELVGKGRGAYYRLP